MNEDNKIFKTNEFSIEISPVGKAIQSKDIQYFSYDENSGLQLIHILMDGKPLDLPNGTEIRLSAVKLNNQNQKLIYTPEIVDPLKGIVSFVIPREFLGYQGQIRCGLYINFSNNQTMHAGYFYINMGVSDIDTNLTEFTEDFWQGWSEFEAGSTAKMQELEQRIDEQTEIFNNADVYNKAEIEDKLEPFALRTDIDSLSIEKADKVAVLADANKFRTDINTLGINKADKEYVDSTLDQVQSGFLGEFQSLADLSAAYPSGRTGFAVIFETVNSVVTGYMYTWKNGTWTKGNVFGGNVVPDKSINRRKLNVSILKTNSSSNMVNQKNTYWGGYVRYQSGAVVSNENYAYVIVPISSDIPFKIYGTNEQGCFKDLSGNYISGYSSVTAMPQTPSNATALWQTVRVDEVEKIYIGTEDGMFEPGDLLDPATIGDTVLKTNKLSFLPMIAKESNFFDKTSVIAGRYINYLSGAAIANANYSVSDFIEIDPRYKWRIEGTNEQFALYDSFGVYVTGRAKAEELENIDLTNDIKYIRLTLRNEEKDALVLKPIQEIDSEWINQESANRIGELLGVESKSTVVVKKDGTADFTSLKQALNSTVPGTIIEFTDIFTVEEEFSQSEISQNTFLGYELKDNKILDGKGVGVIQADLDSDLYSFDNIRQVSPISVTGNGKIRNMTLIGKNCRYACHPDFAGASEFVAENVIFIKENAGTDPQALGAGTKSGQNHRYKNCTFKTEWLQAAAVPASYHTNNGFSEPSTVLFEDCRYITQNDEQQQLRLGAMASNQKNNFEFIGNRLSKILVKEEQMNGSGIDMVLRGRGNRQLTIKVESLSGTEQPALDFVEDVDLI